MGPHKSFAARALSTGALDAAISYNVNHIPSYYLIASKGMIVERLRGVRDVEDVAAEIEKSL